MRKVRCHWLVWGKLLDATRPDRPIVRGFEHAITRRSVGFPDDLVACCTLTEMCGAPVAASVAIAPAARAAGAFLYRPVISASGNYAVFARIQSLSEEGTKPGRQFNQMSVLAVPIEEWHPDLLPVLHAALFEGPYGSPDISSDTNRMGCAAPVFTCTYRSDDSKLPGLLLPILTPAEGMPGVVMSASSFRLATAQLADVLVSSVRCGKVLAALPWALGAAANLIGPGSGFAFRLNLSVAADAPPSMSSRGAFDHLLPLRPWVSFADLIDANGAPVWAKFIETGDSGDATPDADQYLGAVSSDFTLPVPHHRIGFAKFLMRITRNGAEIGAIHSESETFLEKLYDLAPDNSDPSGLVAELRGNCAAIDVHMEDLKFVMQRPTFAAAIGIWEILITPKPNGLALP